MAPVMSAVSEVAAKFFVFPTFAVITIIFLMVVFATFRNERLIDGDVLRQELEHDE